MDSLGSLIMYIVLALAMVVFSVMAVTSRKILRSATYLLFTLFAVAGAYFTFDYDFLGAVQIAVYAGGIVVLFVFSILLTTHPGDNSATLTSGRKVVGLIAAIATFACSIWAVLANCNFCCLERPEMSEQTVTKIGETLMGTGAGQYLLPFEAVSVLLLACIIGGVVIARKR